MDPLRAAVARRGRDVALHVITNGVYGSDPTPPTSGPADAVNAAWSPLLAGQTIPLQGEEVFDVNPGDPSDPPGDPR